jgi:hypothetical protein
MEEQPWKSAKGVANMGAEATGDSAKGQQPQEEQPL